MPVVQYVVVLLLSTTTTWLLEQGVECREVVAGGPEAPFGHVIHVDTGIAAHNHVKRCRLTHAPAVEARGAAAAVVARGERHVAQPHALRRHVCRGGLAQQPPPPRKLCIRPILVHGRQPWVAKRQPLQVEGRAEGPRSVGLEQRRGDVGEHVPGVADAQQVERAAGELWVAAVEGHDKAHDVGSDRGLVTRYFAGIL